MTARRSSALSPPLEMPLLTNTGTGTTAGPLAGTAAGLPEANDAAGTAAVVCPGRARPGVTLRAFCPADVALVQSASLDPLIPLITSVPATPGRLEALAFIARQHERLRSGTGWSFAVADAATNTAVGQIGLWPGQSSRRTGNPNTIGYWIGPEHQKQGYAAAALELLTEWGLTTVKLPQIDLYIEPWNEGSWRTAERAGYRRDALLPSWQKVGTQWKDMYRYIRTASAVT